MTIKTFVRNEFRNKKDKGGNSEMKKKHLKFLKKAAIAIRK